MSLQVGSKGTLKINLTTGVSEPDAGWLEMNGYGPDVVITKAFLANTIQPDSLEAFKVYASAFRAAPDQHQNAEILLGLTTQNGTLFQGRIQSSPATVNGERVAISTVEVVSIASK